MWHRGFPILTGQKVVLVGNGPSLRQSGLGKIIDSFDVVVRFNTYAIKGFEEHVGGKTSFWATGSLEKKPYDVGEIPPAAVYIYSEGPKKLSIPVRDAWGIPRAVYNQARETLLPLSNRSEAEKVSNFPSAGVTVTAWLIENGLSQVALAGFDHFSKEKTGLHHYWNPKTFSKPREHDGDAEALLFKRWEREGKVVYI